MAETKEERSSRPPSYTEPSPAPVAAPVYTDPAPVAAPAYTGPAPVAAPAYTGPAPVAAPAYTGPAPQQAMFMPQGGVVPQQGYVIQNVPVPTQTGCCGGRSDKFKHRAGVTTGIIHLVVAFVSIALSVCTFVLVDEVEQGYYGGMGVALGGAVICFIPAGILGVLTKYKSNCVIVGYLVMTILSAMMALFVMYVEIPAAIFSSYKYYECPDYNYYHDNVMDVAPEFVPERASTFCGYHLVVSVLVIHIALAVVSFIEFISAIVGASFCCGGLRCCCTQGSQQQSTTMMYYTPIGQPQAAPGTGQVAVHVAPAAGAEAGPLPQKA